MNISQHINSIFNSNTYLIEDKAYDYCWLIDIGDTDYLIDKSLNIKGIFITHSHFDHIYGINEILEKNWPRPASKTEIELKIYGT